MNEIEELRALARKLAAQGEAARASGDMPAALEAFHQGHVCDLAADLLEKKTLQAPVNAATVDRPMFTPEHRVALSKAVTAPKDKFAKAVHDAGLTMAGLARAVGIHPSQITLARQGKRPMPIAKAEHIERLTGFPVSAWPRLS